MNNIISFAIGFISSLFASYIFSLAGFLSRIIPPSFRKSFDREFKNQKKALNSIKRDAKNSTTLRVLAMKGDTFSHPGDSGHLHDLLINGPIKQKYLISDPDNPYVNQRAEELGNHNLRLGIENSIGSFQDIVSRNSNITVIKHREIVRFRLIIFENSLYLSFQPPGTPGKTSPMQRYVRPSSGYFAIEAYFNDLWKKYGGTD